MYPSLRLRIRSERQKRGWTLRFVGRLAAESGYHRAMTPIEVSGIERGRVNPTAAELDALSRVYQIPPEDLLVEIVEVVP